MPRKMQVLSLGMPRTGSASLAEAFRILGYQGVFHGLDALDDDTVFQKLGRAADAEYPCLPTYTGKPFTRADWDTIYSEYEVSTDLAAFFAPQLIKAYPDAKVVLVRREYDAWYKSFVEAVVEPSESAITQFHIKYTEPLAGLSTAASGMKMTLGCFEANDYQEVRKNARRIYEAHYRTIEELVPPERLLWYDLKQGWGPLCKFLDKPVPEVPFPRVNETAALRAKIREKVLRDALPVLLKVGAGAAVVAALSWAWMR